MKRSLLAVLTGIGTFALGITLAAQYYFDRTEPVATVSVQTMLPLRDCKENSSSYPGLSKALDKIKKFKNGFFPEKAFDDGWRSSDESFNHWYGRHLRAMKEPSLLDIKDEDIEVYRFLWLRTFDHPVAIRFERDGYSFTLKSVELSGAGGYEPGRLWRTDDIPVSRAEWCEFTALLDKAKYWNEPTADPKEGGNDGSQWIIEGLNDGRYHIVDRWAPREGDFREACLYLLKLSGRDEKSLGGDLY